MKKIYSLLLFLCCSLNIKMYAPDDENKIPNGVNIHIHNKPSNDTTVTTKSKSHSKSKSKSKTKNKSKTENESTSDIKSDNKSDAKSESKNINVIENKTNLQLFLDYASNLPITDTKNSIMSWLKNHPTLILGTTTSGFYCSLCAYLLVTYHAINTSVWRNWKSSLTTQELYEQARNQETKKELFKKLVQDIFRYHLNAQDPTNTIKPLADFAHEIVYEIAKTDRFILISELLMSARLSYILPINKEKLALAKKYRSRLMFLNNLFKAWAASCNFNKV